MESRFHDCQELRRKMGTQKKAGMAVGHRSVEMLMSYILIDQNPDFWYCSTVLHVRGRISLVFYSCVWIYNYVKELIRNLLYSWNNEVFLFSWLNPDWHSPDLKLTISRQCLLMSVTGSHDSRFIPEKVGSCPLMFPSVTPLHLRKPFYSVVHSGTQDQSLAKSSLSPTFPLAFPPFSCSNWDVALLWGHHFPLQTSQMRLFVFPLF